ncbi:MAG: hypothetical protein ACP5HS_08605 [Anaerolineae bacterium]
MKPLTVVRVWMLFILMGLISGCMQTSQSFEDDFSDPASGWAASSHETYVRGYQQGKYLFQIDVPEWFVWATSGRNFKDVELEVVARAAGSSDNHYGLLCRYNEGRFYYFAISSDGYYAIFRMDEEDDLRPLTGRAMLRSDAIRVDGTDNRLMASCQGTTLTLYVNGQRVAQVEDEVLEQGDVGMGAGSASQGGTSVWFDDFEALNP